jgi:HlyD family secretion protein
MAMASRAELPIRYAFFAPLAAAALFAGACGRAVPVRIAEARRESLSVPVLCDGTLEPGPSGELRAPEAAEVGDIFVREGQRVETGATVVRLSSTDLLARSRENRSIALTVSADREAAKAELAASEADLARKRKTAEADERLLAAGAISRETRDADAASLREGSARFAAAKSKLASLDGSGGEGSRVALANRTAGDLERRVAALTLRAPFAGIVSGLPRHAGERVEAGQVVASVTDPAHIRVRARVDEPDLPRIAAGQPISVTFDGLPNRRWPGRVTAVAAGLRDDSGRRVGDVLGEISNPDRTLPPNASVNVSIIAGQKDGALVIPRAALQRSGENRWIWVWESGRARRRDVSVGLLGLADAEVTSGLKEGERVILPGGGALSDGARVTVEGS